MQYKEEYDIVETKEEFISILYSNYEVRWETAERRWYDLHKLFPKIKNVVYTTDKFVALINKEEEKNTIIENENEKYFIKELIKEKLVLKKYPSDEVLQPSRMKMLELENMKRLGHKITRNFLLKYGFANIEINWLDEKGELEETK